MENGEQEVPDLMRQFVRIFMGPSLRNTLSQYVKIDKIVCVYYMLTKNVKQSTGATACHGGWPLPE